MIILLDQGFKKAWTKYDHIPSNENFRRYEKIDWLESGKQIRITIDFFESKTIETVKINGWQVVEPKTLLSFYSNIHTSDKCWAVKAALQLVQKGESPIGNVLLSKNPLEKV
ncbi:MAG: hypothetical protein ABJK28_05755 [Algibacter sp.]